MHPHASLYQINTRVRLTELSATLHRTATLDDIPDASWDQLAEQGFDWIWLLSVWTTGERGRQVSCTNQGWRKEFEETLPDLQEADIGGSGFAIADYHVHPALGGDASLKRLREKLHQRGLKLMLDFVPNHLGPDHPWVQAQPDYFISGTRADLKNNPHNYGKFGKTIFAYGRDPYFSGWPDTVQLDYSKPEVVAAMQHELIRMAGQCDGVRCDMAMLILPEVFEKTWGRKAQPFWPEAIRAVRKQHPDFCFMGEVYWDMEWTLQQEGFDYTYDKRLYDRLREGRAKPVRDHFAAGLEYQNKLVRFLENHDEARAATAFDFRKHLAAAIITYLAPGLRFFHQGQLEGKQKRISPHLIRGPLETIDSGVHLFYSDLLSLLRQPLFHAQWQLVPCQPAWDGNGSWDSYLVFAWEEQAGRRALVVVNFAPHASQCYVRLPYTEVANRHVEFRDLMSVALYYHEGNEVLSRGIYFDLPAWGYHVFEVSAS